MTHQKKNDGFVLLTVMFSLIVATLALSAVYKYGEIAKIQYAGNPNERQAFWCAEAGITEIKIMASSGMRPFGQNGLPTTGNNVISGTLGAGTYRVDVTNVSQNTYTVTSSGQCKGHTNIITMTAYLEPYNAAVLSTANNPKKPIWITAQDAFFGPIYIHGPLNIYKSNHWCPVKV